jgi:two-component sensor histidine kinase
MMQEDQETLIVSIADNWVGLPANLNLSTAKSLGIKLIKELTSQLKGKFTFTNDAGFGVMISVPIIKVLKLG